MLAKMSMTLLASTLVLAVTPMAGTAQESAPDVPQPESPPVDRSAQDVEVTSNSRPVVVALRLSSEYAALIAPAVLEPPLGDELTQMEEETPAPPAAASKGSGTGLGFMIGGAAAFVGGLIIGGTGGTIIAAGGVGLGVYGAIIYF